MSLGIFSNNSLEFKNGATTIVKQTATSDKLSFYGDSNNLVTLSNVANPVSIQDVATKNYVDNKENTINCFAASTANLTSVYSNETSGVGATLTNSGTQVQFTIDSISVSQGEMILIKNQISTFQNGIYNLTNIGSISTNWVLTRNSNYDQITEIKQGNLIIIKNGTINSSSTWVQTAVVTVIGTSPIIFTSFVPITGLSGDISASGPGVVSSTLATVNSNVGTFGTSTSIASFTVNGKGLITSASNIQIKYTYTNVNTPTYTILSTDQYIGITYTITGPCTITLPLISTIGQFICTIIDEGGNAGNNFITIVPSGANVISGDTSVILNGNYNSISIYNNGTDWFIF